MLREITPLSPARLLGRQNRIPRRDIHRALALRHRRPQRRANRRGGGRPAVIADPAIALVIIELAAPERIVEPGEGEALIDREPGRNAVEPLLGRIKLMVGDARHHVMRRMLANVMDEHREPAREREMERNLLHRHGFLAVHGAVEPGNIGMGVVDEDGEGKQRLPDIERHHEAKDEGRYRAGRGIEWRAGEQGEKSGEIDREDREIPPCRGQEAGREQRGAGEEPHHPPALDDVVRREA